MADFNPTEKLEQMLGQQSTALALESAEKRVREYSETNAELAGLWVQVRDSLSGRLVDEIKAQEATEAARLAELTAVGDKSYAAFCKAKGIKAPK